MKFLVVHTEGQSPSKSILTVSGPLPVTSNIVTCRNFNVSYVEITKK